MFKEKLPESTYHPITFDFKDQSRAQLACYSYPSMNLTIFKMVLYNPEIRNLISIDAVKNNEKGFFNNSFIFNTHSLTIADDSVTDFQIEGMSIGDARLFSKSDIINNSQDYYKNKNSQKFKMIFMILRYMTL